MVRTKFITIYTEKRELYSIYPKEAIWGVISAISVEVALAILL